MKTNKKLYILLTCLSVASILLYGCKTNNAEELYPTPIACDTANAKYSTHVAPILNSNCAISGCHTSSTLAAGYAYHSYAATMLSVNNNKLINSIKHIAGTSAMPQGAFKLSDCDINKIQAWINNGALNN